MKLRIHRTFYWGYKGDPFHVRFGGDNQLSLMHRDQLQCLSSEGQWDVVPVVEADKPEHPKAAQERERADRTSAALKEIFENSRTVTWEELQKENTKAVLDKLGKR